MREATLIDVRGLKCPLPVLMTAKRMRRHRAGTRFVVLADDPMAAIDVPNFCREEGHLLVGTRREARVLRFEIEKG
jgi:tRNA 2-thiouridine synthesizing protein A